MRQQVKHRLTFVFVVLAVVGSSVFADPVKRTPDSVPGEVLVNIVPGSSKGDIEAIEHLGDVDHSEHIANVRNGAIWRMHSRGKNTEALVAALQRNPKVAYAEPNYIVQSSATPNDPYYSQLYALQKVIGAEQAWDVTTGSASIVVGVVDTGINYTHPDLAPNVWSNPGGKGNSACAAGTHGFNALTSTCDPRDDHYHGTHVSGTIGAVGNNGVGVTGVNWTTSIMGLKFLDSQGYGTISGAITAIDFAVQAKIDGVNVRVLSNSWGGLGFSKALFDEINKAGENDILFVASAGNDHADNDLDPHYPSSYSASNLIAVAATDSFDRLASFSNFGLKSVHLGAPGVSILSTYSDGYAALSGTSMAAPHVAGAAALLLAQSPSLTTAQVKSAILANTEPIESLNGKTVTGGRLSLARMFGFPSPPGFSIAVTPASRTIAGGESATFTVTITPETGFSEPVTLTFGGLQSTWTAVFSPNPTTTTSTLTIWTTPGGAVSAPLTVFGQSSHRLQSATANLIVTAAPASCLSFSGAVDSIAGNDANSLATADFNRDGKVDFVAPDVERNRVVVIFGGAAGSPGATPAAGTAPMFVAAGDVNGDGKADIVTANSGSNDVSVLIGGGDGTFQTAVAYSVGASPFAVATGDFNRDGKLDLVTANNGSSSVSVLLGNGNGTFQNAVPYGAASGPFWLSVADLNRDGNADLLVANFNADNVSVLLGNGDGTFQTAANFAAGDGPSAIAIGDWNGDGNLDLAVSNYNSAYVSLLGGHGDGTFAAATNLPLAGGAVSVAAGDLNGDGKADLAVARRSNEIALFTGNGDGTFAIRPLLAASAYSVNHVLILDATGDGRNDVVAAVTTSTGVVRTWANTSSCSLNCGVIGPAVNDTAGSSPAGVAAGDFNGDGKADIAVANNNSNDASILLGNGDGSLQPASNYAAGNAPRSVAAADFNRDGRADLVVADSSSNMVAFLAGNPNGTFQAATFQAVGTTPEGLATGDFDRDGKLDVVTANSASNNISLLRGNGDGTFASHVEIAAGSAPLAVAAIDVNRDGNLDVAVANSGSNNVSILVGNGDGTFVPAVQYGAGSAPSSIAIADLNRDGKQDLVVANATSNDVSVLLGKSDGTFQPQVTYAAGTNPSSVSIADFDGDGKLDIAVARRGSNDMATLRGNGDGTFAAAVSRGSGNAPASIAVADFNGDGRPDLVTANATSNNVSIAVDTCPVPDLTIAKSHSGTFVQGDSDRVYTLTVANAGAAATSGIVTVVDTLPAGLLPVAMSGTGWNCSPSTVSCTRQDSLAAGASYPAISLTVRVSAATNVTNSASVSGGGENNLGNDTATDPTSIAPITDLVITSSHSGDFTQGDSGKTYTVIVKNRGGAATNGMITVTDTLPAGLTATSIGGSGWSCNLPTLTCQRNDSIAGSANAPALTITFDIAADAPSSVMNVASVSGGGQADTSNDVARDLTVIWKRDGCGAFGAANNYSIPYGAFTLMSGDFNDDGNVDLVAGIDSTSQGLAILLGNANGTFSQPATIPTTGRPGAVRVADFDGDGKLDILMSRISTGVISFDVLRGNGNGTFAPAVVTQISTTTAYYPSSSIVVDDFNLDSRLDIVLSDDSSYGYTVLLGRGDGSFDPPVRTTLSSSTVPLASADFNGDGRKDFVARVSYNSVGLFIGDGNGGFAAPVVYPMPSDIGSVTVCDLNGDGRPDLVASSYGAFFILFGNADGTLTTPARVDFSSGPIKSIKAGDLNGDGKQDLIVVSSYYGLYLFIGDGSGGLSARGQLDGYYYDFGELITGDFNHDGTLDIAALSYSYVSTYLGGCADFTITKSHTGNFRQGQTGATYTLRVKNLGPAVGGSVVTVTDQLPPGLTATAMSGYSWTCDVTKLSCTAGRTVSVGSYYDDILVTVSVALDAAPSVVNTATVSATADRNPANNTATDPTTITAAPDLTLSKSHTGNFGRGQNAAYTITVRNVGAAATTGQVQVTESAPQGLTIVSMSGTGWTCQSSSCSRSDILGPGTDYPPITVTAAVAANAPLTITNVATVSTSGEGLTSNNSASDPTQIMWEPLNVAATAATSSSVSLTWSAVAGATSYVVFRADQIGSPFTQVGTSMTTGFVDQPLQAGKSYLYMVCAADGANLGSPSAADVATTIVFTDDPIVANATMIKAVHLAEIRVAVNALRALAGLAPVTFAEEINNSVFVKATHINELRAALDAARATLAQPAMSYIDPVLNGGYLVKASHIQQLRAGVK
jgi:uncharacterized repeat protein (TIGR01451 family)